MTLKTPNTHKNELLLQRVFKIVVSATDLTPEFKLVFKAYINETIGDIRERGIASYHDLIDYLREKAEQGIDCNVWLTPEQKEALKSETQEHHLYLNEKGEYELLEMEMLPTPAKAKNARAFIFERGGKRMIAYWHTSASAKLSVDLGKPATVALDKLRYLETSLSLDEAKAAWAAAEEK